MVVLDDFPRTKGVYLMIDDQLDRQLDEAAQALGTTRSRVVRHLLQQAFAKQSGTAKSDARKPTVRKEG